MFLRGLLQRANSWRGTHLAKRLACATVVVITLSSLSSCACRSYDIELLPQSDMNRRLSAVRVDVVWTTADDAEELRTSSSLEWFLGSDPLCRQRRFEGRIATTEVSLQDIGSSAIAVGEGKLSPPEGREVNGFVIFALYAGMDQLPKDALTAYYDSALGRTQAAQIKTCKFRVRLQSARIALEPEAPKSLLERLQ